MHLNLGIHYNPEILSRRTAIEPAFPSIFLYFPKGVFLASALYLSTGTQEILLISFRPSLRSPELVQAADLPLLCFSFCHTWVHRASPPFSGVANNTSGGRMKYSTQYRHSFDGLIFDIHRLVHDLISFAPCSHNFICRVCPSFANENIMRDSRKLTNFQMHNFYFSPPTHEAYHPEEMWVNLTDCP